MTARRRRLPTLMYVERDARPRYGRSARKLLVAAWRRTFGAAALVAIVVAPSHALESWGAPDMRQQDKQAHALGGALVGSLTAVVLERVAPGWRPWQRVLAGFGAAVVAGTVHELLDPPSGKDPKDAIATSAGGALGAVSVEFILHL